MCMVWWGGHMRCPCVYCLCLAGRVSFSTRPQVQSLTTVTSTNNIDPHLKFQLYVEDRGHWKPVLIFSNGLSKPRDRAQNTNLISAMGGIRTHNLLIDSPACYHWALTAFHRSLVTNLVASLQYKMTLARAMPTNFINMLYVVHNRLNLLKEQRVLLRNKF